MSVFEYKESLMTVRRKGDVDDPFIDIGIDIMVKNGYVQLPEIPDSFEKVIVTGNGETWLEITDEEMPSGTWYKVSYAHGYVGFDPINNGKMLHFSFKGTGNTFLSAHRVWVTTDGHTVNKTLGDIIDSGEQAIEAIETLAELVGDIHEAIDNAEEATEAAVETNQAVQTAEESRVSSESTRVSNENSRISNETARTSTESSRVAAEDARNTAESTRTGNETARENAESTRASNENTRMVNEDARQGNESTRQSNETTRQNNELGRQIKMASFQYAGLYNSLTAYLKNNQVTYNNETYICILDSTGILPTNTTYWSKIAAKGIDGTGSVVSVTSANDDIAIGGSAANPVLTINSGTSANQIAKYDGSGRLKSAAPSAGDDVARKQEVDNIRADNTKPFIVEVRTSDPVSPSIGQIWFRSDL
jgi:hypothetical protein